MITSLTSLLLAFLWSSTTVADPATLNNDAVQLFVNGNVQAAHNILLTLTTSQPSIDGVVHKNLAWIETVLQKSTQAALTWKHLHTTFLRKIFSGGNHPARAADDPRYRSLFLESPFGEQLCNHPSFAFDRRHGN